MQHVRNTNPLVPVILGGLVLLGVGGTRDRAEAQGPAIRYGAKVPQDVRMIYERGLNYLARSQQENGTWPSAYGQGITGICLLAFLADGEDPNYGQYSLVVRRAIRAIITSQDPNYRLYTKQYVLPWIWHVGTGRIVRRRRRIPTLGRRKSSHSAAIDRSGVGIGRARCRDRTEEQPGWRLALLAE